LGCDSTDAVAWRGERVEAVRLATGFDPIAAAVEALSRLMADVRFDCILGGSAPVDRSALHDRLRLIGMRQLMVLQADGCCQSWPAGTPSNHSSIVAGSHSARRSAQRAGIGQFMTWHATDGGARCVLNASESDTLAFIESSDASSVLDAAKSLTRRPDRSPSKTWLIAYGKRIGPEPFETVDFVGLAGVMIPANSGILPAIGLLESDWSCDVSLEIEPIQIDPDRAAGNAPRVRFSDLNRQSPPPPKEADLDRIHRGFTSLMEQVADAIQRDGLEQDDCILTRRAEMGYAGDERRITVELEFVSSLADIAESFRRAFHEQYRCGRLDAPIEVFGLDLLAKAATPNPPTTLLHGPREVVEERTSKARRFLEPGRAFEGPAVIRDEFSEVRAGPGWLLLADEVGNIIFERRS
jgi:hypothetical protein